MLLNQVRQQLRVHLEELLFRGLLQGWLRPFGPVVAVAGSALLFALLHGRAPSVVAAAFGGTALGLAALCSGSLVPGMLFHLYNNTLAFVGQYCQQYGAPQAVSYILMFLPPLAALAFALTYGGTLPEAFVSALTGLVTAVCLYACRRLRATVWRF